FLKPHGTTLSQSEAVDSHFGSTLYCAPTSRAWDGPSDCVFKVVHRYVV
ncbi:hypothetical protein QE152_g40842, partial [Popillia japonica]